MPETNLPEHVSANMAAALIGRSPRRIARLVEAGLLPSGGNHWRRISLVDIEQFTGRTITAADYLAARARLRTNPTARSQREGISRPTKDASREYATAAIL